MRFISGWLLVLFVVPGVSDLAFAAGPDLQVIAEGTLEGGIGPLRLTAECKADAAIVFSPVPWVRNTAATNALGDAPLQIITATYTYTLTGKVTRIMASTPGQPFNLYGTLDAKWREEKIYAYDFSRLNWTEQRRQQYLNDLPDFQKPGPHIRDETYTRNFYFDLAPGARFCPLFSEVPCMTVIKAPPPALRPVLFLAGIGGTYSADLEQDTPWMDQRGRPPLTLTIDPLGKVYDHTLQSLRNAGYVDGETLFVANYDWRMPPAPFDGRRDGTVRGYDPANLFDDKYEFGIDYLAFWLRRAQEAWHAMYPTAPSLTHVDAVTHSTGGIVVRSYLQSDVFGAFYTTSEGKSERLPGIQNFIMFAVPNQGAPKIWNPWNDNWASEKAYKYVLSKIVNRAYKHVNDGTWIDAPNSADVIRLADILNPEGQPVPELFLHRYVPTMRGLLPTYDFILRGENPPANINNDPRHANDLLLDLNTDFSALWTRTASSVIYSSNLRTPVRVRQRVGPVGIATSDPIQRFTDYTDRNAKENEIWFEEIVEDNAGDGTVPAFSAQGLFTGDSRIRRYLISQGDTTHTGLMSNKEAQETMFRMLGFGPVPTNIVVGAPWENYDAALSVGSDPVDCFVADARGRRLGYTRQAGVLTEIPNSVWTGQADGVGWVLGPLELPLTMHFIGRGEDYKVQMQMHEGDRELQQEWSGFLAAGQMQQQVLQLPASGPRITTIARSSQGLRIDFQADLSAGTPGLESASALGGPWSVVGAAYESLSNGGRFQLGAPASGTRFYRVSLQR